MLLPIACALSACADAEPRACKPARAHWQQPHNFDGLDTFKNDVSITRDGAVYWNGQRISDTKLIDYLKASHQIVPEPEVFLHAEMGVSCAKLEKVRDWMEQSLECKGAFSSCAEGIKEVWRELPTPPGTPPS
jgi:hypothetical protein